MAHQELNTPNTWSHGLTLNSFKCHIDHIVKKMNLCVVLPFLPFQKLFIGCSLFLNGCNSLCCFSIYQLRNSTKLIFLFLRKSIAEKALMFKAPSDWINLPVNIQKWKKMVHFKGLFLIKNFQHSSICALMTVDFYSPF